MMLTVLFLLDPQDVSVSPLIGQAGSQAGPCCNIDFPNTTVLIREQSVTNMNSMFENYDIASSGNINGWDVSVCVCCILFKVSYCQASHHFHLF